MGQLVQTPRFLNYVEQILVPALAPGDIVIMDNLGSLKMMRFAAPFARPGQTATLYVLGVEYLNTKLWLPSLQSRRE